MKIILTFGRNTITSETIVMKYLYRLHLGLGLCTNVTLRQLFQSYEILMYRCEGCFIKIGAMLTDGFVYVTSVPLCMLYSLQSHKSSICLQCRT